MNGILHVQDQCITFDKQIEYYSGVYASLARSLGQDQAMSHLAKSIFAITIGSNDIIHYAKANTATARAQNPSQQFVDTLIRSLTGQLQVTYICSLQRLVGLHLLESEIYCGTESVSPDKSLDG